MTELGYTVRGVGFINPHTHFEHCLDIIDNGDDLAAHCDDIKLKSPSPIGGLAECDILWARNDVEWDDYSQLPPVSGVELFNYHWVAKGPLFNVKITKFS